MAERARTIRGRRSTIAALAALPLLLGGCGLIGGDDPSPTSTTSGTTSGSTASTSSQTGSSTSSSSTPAPGGVTVAEIFGAARTTALAAKSGRVVGSVTSEGEKVSLDLTGTTDGTNQKLRLTTSDGTVTVYTVDGKFYLVAGEEYWKKNAGDTAAEQLADKFVLMSEEDASSFGAFTIGSLLKEMFADTELSPLDVTRATVTPTAVNGEQVYVLTDELSDTGKVLVTADGKAQLRSVRVGGANPAALTFGSWDVVAPIKAPAAKDVVKL